MREVVRTAVGDGSVRQGTTDLLNLWSRGRADAWSRVLDRVYPDLKRMAGSRARRESLAIEPSDLVQELYFRLERQQGVDWANREHFFALAARLIRRVLVDQARSAGRLKRGARSPHVPVDDIEIVDDDRSAEHMTIHQALERLARESPAAAKVVELRYFGGLTLDEAADVLGITRRTVARRWRFARAWLFDLLRSRDVA